MMPGVAGTQTARRAVGIGRALDLILTGRWLNAEEALRIGSVSRVVPHSTLDAVLVDVGRRLCELPAALVTRVKRAVHDGLDLSLADGLALERRLAS